MNIFFFKDNDRKYMSKLIKFWMEEKGIFENVMVIFVLILDFNFIENIWLVMKIYLRSVVKLKKKDDFVKGIYVFWKILMVEKCVKYIDYVYWVILDGILNYGGLI